MERDTKTLLAEVDACLMEGKLHRAFEICVQAGNLTLDDPDLLLGVGLKFGSIGFQCFFHEENYLLALNAYWMALMLIPGDYLDDVGDIDSLERPNIRYSIGQCYIELEQWEEAISALQSATQKPPYGMESEPFDTLGELYFSLGRYEEGIEVYRDGLRVVIEHHKDNTDYLDLAVDKIIWAYQKLEKKPEELLNILEEYIDSAVDYDLAIIWCQVYMNYAEPLGKEKYKEALQFVVNFHDGMTGHESLDMDSYAFDQPDNYCLGALAHLGKIYLDENNYHEANRYLDAVLVWDENNSFAQENMARLKLKLKDLVGAERCLEKVKSVSPDSAAIWEIEVDLLLQKENYEEALDAAEERIGLLHEKKLKSTEVSNRESEVLATLYLRKIDALVKLDRSEEAIETLKRARDEFPKVETFYLYAALLLYLSNRPGEAMEVLKSAEKENILGSYRMTEVRNKITTELGHA